MKIIQNGKTCQKAGLINEIPAFRRNDKIKNKHEVQQFRKTI